MNLLEALILGAVQGATEFLPISSSGHLVLGQNLLGIKEPQLLFDIVLHVGTLLSVVIFYRADILLILRGMFQGVRGLREEAETMGDRLRAAFAPEGVRLATLVVLATLPTGVLGLLLERIIEPKDGVALITPKMVCGILILNGFLLALNLPLQRRDERGEFTKREGALALWNITPAVALAIGIAQGLAVMPGISRSGMTITMALLLGVQRLNAARYSFLLSIPAILGALVLKMNLQLFTQNTDLLFIFIAGALCAGGVGYVCLIILTKMLERAQFHQFAIYCWAIGLIGLIAL